MSTQTYNSGFLKLVDGTIAWGAETTDVYAILVNSTGAAAFDRTHNTYEQVKTNELTPAGGGYSRQNVAHGGRTVALSTNDVLFDCADVTFGSDVTINASGGAIIFLEGNNASPQDGDQLLFFWQLPDPASSTNGTFTVRVPNGIIRISDA